MALLAAFALLGAVGAAMAGGGPGSAFGEPLRIAHTAWAVGVGEAMAASADGVSAISMNPAGIIGTAVTTVSATHTFQVQALDQDYLTYAQRLPAGVAVGGGFYYLYDSSNRRTLEDGNGNYAGEGGGFPVGFGIATAAAAMDIGPITPSIEWMRPSAGACVRVIWQQVDRESWYGGTVDIGLKVRPGSGFIIGGVMQNAGGVGGGLGLPLQWVTGLAWQGEKVVAENDSVLAELDLPLAVDRRLMVKTGLEYRLKWDTFSLALRGGWKQEQQVPGAPGLTAGMGLRWYSALAPWGVDYAFAPWGVLGSLHSVALTVGLVARPPETVPMPMAEKKPPREPPTVIYPLKGEKAVFRFSVGEPAVLSAEVQDEGGSRILALEERHVVPAGPVEVVWDGLVAPGTLANVDVTHRVLVQLGERTYYMDVIVKKE